MPDQEDNTVIRLIHKIDTDHNASMDDLMELNKLLLDKGWAHRMPAPFCQAVYPSSIIIEGD